MTGTEITPPTEAQRDVISEDDFVFVPLEKLQEPIEGHVNCLKDRWWSVHPEKGLAFYKPKGRNGKRQSGQGNQYGSPQCNRNKAIAERLSSRHSWAELQFVEVAFVPLIINDYIC